MKLNSYIKYKYIGSAPSHPAWRHWLAQSQTVDFVNSSLLEEDQLPLNSLLNFMTF